MACEKNTGKISATAAVKAGIGMLQNKFNSATGRMVSSLSNSVGRSATATLWVLESFDGPRSLDSLGALPLLVEAGTLLGWLRAKRYKDVPDWWFARSREKRRERQELGQMADVVG